MAEEQTGAGQRLWQAEQFYSLREIAQRHIRKFNTTGIDYLLTLQPQPGGPPLSEQLGCIFDSMVQEMTQGMAQQDLVRFVLQSRSLTYPISLPFMPQHELTADRITGEVQRFLQSNEHVNLEDGMNVHMVHVGMPQGGTGAVRKRKHYGFKLDKFLSTKKSVIRIQNKDSLCLARALVTDMARQEKHPYWSNIRRGRQRQGFLARQLHQKANISEGPCGLAEVEKFQASLPDYQLIVLSAEHFNAIVYEGPKREKQIYLYHHHNHFDIITSVSAFLGKSYWCLECKKGFNNKADHRCSKVCICCYAEGCAGMLHQAPWRECGSCHRMFRGDDCYANHCRPNKHGESVCQKFYKCLQCKKVMSYQRRKPEDHQCGEAMCRTCREFMDPNTHLCYIQPIESEGEKQRKKKKYRGRKRQRTVNEFIDESAEEVEEEDDEDEQEYLFFDIESRQDNGRHIANLLILQDHNGTEWVFEGDNCVDQFGTWLLDGSHEGAIVIAHNLRGYDGYLLLEWFYDQFLLPKLILNGAEHKQTCRAVLLSFLLTFVNSV